MPYQQTQSTSATVNTELTPLNSNNSQTFHQKMDAETKKVVRKIVIDVVLLACGRFE
jgi:Asp/Glu/hydantoin racemase